MLTKVFKRVSGWKIPDRILLANSHNHRLLSDSISSNSTHNIAIDHISWCLYNGKIKSVAGLVPTRLWTKIFNNSCAQVLAVDLLNPSPQAEAKSHKLKVAFLVLQCTQDLLTIIRQTLVPGPRSFFMDVKCPGCFNITTVFSHAQTVVVCAGKKITWKRNHIGSLTIHAGCSQVLCQPTGGKARLTEGCSFRRK